MIDSKSNNETMHFFDRSILILLCSYIIAFAYSLIFLSYNGYLPTPFIYDKHDTFMDLYNPMYHSLLHDEYTIWKSVYPPLNFLFTNLLIAASNLNHISITTNNSFELRENFSYAANLYCYLFVLSVIFVLNSKIWHKFNAVSLASKFVLVTFSYITLFALERGNLVVFIPFLMCLSLSNSRIKKCVSFGIMVNIKPYLAILLLADLLKAKYIDFFISCFIIVFVFITSGLILGDEFNLFFKNIFIFRTASLHSFRDFISLPISIDAYSFILNDLARADINIYLKILFFKLSNIILYFRNLLIVLLIFVLIIKRKYIEYKYIYISLLVMLANYSFKYGSYILIFYIAVFPVFYIYLSQNKYSILMFIFCLFPLGFVSIFNIENFITITYITGSSINLPISINAGILLPVFNVGLLLSIIYNIIKFNVISVRKTIPYAAR